MSLVERGVKDSRLLRLLGKWLATGWVEGKMVGVIEQSEERLREGERGCPADATPQRRLGPWYARGGSPLVHEWRKSEAKGQVYIVRYADDVVLAFESQEDAERLVTQLDERLQEYGLTLNRDKTRLLRFGQHWTGKDGGPKSGTFEFLGFTHIAGKSLKGRYLVKRKTSRKRLNRSLKAISDWCKHNRHRPLGYQWKELSRKLQGHYQYFGIRGNSRALNVFRDKVKTRWLKALMRRSQKVCLKRLYWLLDKRFLLPPPRLTHHEGWLELNPGYLLGRAGCGKAARPVL